jgi:hypothetical protein
VAVVRYLSALGVRGGESSRTGTDRAGASGMPTVPHDLAPLTSIFKLLTGYRRQKCTISDWTDADDSLPIPCGSERTPPPWRTPPAPPVLCT